MSKTKVIKIKCLHCGKWFPSPIYFGDSLSFDTSTLIGNIVQCRFCNEMTKCNKENMKIEYEDGGFIGNDTM